MLPVPDLLVRLTGGYWIAVAVLYGPPAVLVLLVLLVVWLVFGRGPRRRRGMKRARASLQSGNWQEALEHVRKVRRIGSPSLAWRGTFDAFEAECLAVAARAALDEEDYEQALEHQLRGAQVLGKSGAEVRASMQGLMLAEVRRLFSSGLREGDTRPVTELIARTLMIQSPCREASFWQGLCDLRAGHTDQAIANLQIARTGAARSLDLDGPGDVNPADGPKPAPPPSPFIDPSLYLGAVLVRRGEPKEAMRYLTEANRMEANCPVVTLQLGVAMIDAGADTPFAVRALQRALGPRGLAQWADEPRRAWTEGFPEHRSYVRKLASAHPYSCPLFGADLRLLMRQGHLALARGQFRLGNYAESAELFDKVLKEGAPTLEVLRGLGLSLARLGRYDEAFKHLRTAHEMEATQDRLTAGYLALCGACGTPSSEEDRLQNVAWAVRVLTQFNAPGDEEWTHLVSTVFAEARRHDVLLSADDELYLCEHLLSVSATDEKAAHALHNLAETHPALMRPEYAWLYCRADQLHDVGGDHALQLYAQTFADPAAARAFFEARQWDFDELEFHYLRRTAEHAPGRFPEPLGPDYPSRGESQLLARSEVLEKAGNMPGALDTIAVLAKLSPSNTRALDRTAALHYRLGQHEQATELLEQWHRQRPDDPLPLVRQAVLLHQRDQDDACQDRVRRAMALCTGRRRANVALLGARLLLQGFLAPESPDRPGNPSAPDSARELLEDCVQQDPRHADALWCLAAVRWLQGDNAGLAAQAPAMARAGVTEPRFQFLAALCHLAGSDYAGTLRACQGAFEHRPTHAGRNGDAAKPDLATESRYVAALAQVGLGDNAGAIESLQAVTRGTGPTSNLARALLGAVQFAERRHDEAVHSWQTLDAKDRQAWGLNEPLAHALFVAAIEDLLRANYEHAAEKFRQSGRQGCRDRRLGPLLLMSLFKAGQLAIYGGETAGVGP